MKRTEVINRAIKHFNAFSYLEIGLGNGNNFKNVKATYKISVDPKGFATYNTTSDEFFVHNTSKFDFIFIDGLHLEEQVHKDILNSLNILHKEGTILCHDVSPAVKEDQVREYVPGKTWNGDVWKAWVKLRKERKDLEMYVINIDCGCGVIRQGKESFVGDAFDDETELTFENLDKHRTEWLNLIEPEDIEWLE